MYNTKILVVGRHEQILQTVLRLINQNDDRIADAAITDEEAKNLFSLNLYDLVLLGGGLDESSEKKLRLYFITLNPEIKIVQHYGGGSGLLYGEIKNALDS